MQDKKYKIIFIHGFGVSKNARGIFTDIENYLNNHLSNNSHAKIKCIFTDLNQVEYKEEKELIVVNPLSVQAKIIEKVIKNEIENDLEKNENYNYVFIAHSQGCAIATLINENNFPENIKKIFLNSQFFFLAPPESNNIQKIIDKYKQKEKNILDINGVSQLFRKNGSVTTIPKEYWLDINSINYLENYKNFSNKLKEKDKLIIIIAENDEIIENSTEIIEELKKIATVILTVGSHNFTNTRQELSDLIKQNL